MPPLSGDASPDGTAGDSSAPLLLPRPALSTATSSPTRISPAPSFLSYFSRSASGASSQSPSQSTATSPVSPSQQRRLPKEELDEEDLAARREMEEAMRSFGIEDPEVNVRSRAEDPLLVVEARTEADTEGDGEGEGDPEAADETATTGRTGTATPELTVSPGSGLLSDEVEHPPDSPGARPRPVDVEQTPVAEQGATMSRAGSRRCVGEKPPVPPRRTPRIGTTSATSSPAISQGEVVEEKVERPTVEEQRDEDGSEEKVDGGEPGGEQRGDACETVGTVEGEARDDSEEHKGEEEVQRVDEASATPEHGDKQAQDEARIEGEVQEDQHREQDE